MYNIHNAQNLVIALLQWLPYSRSGGSYPGSFQRRRFTNEDIMVTLPDGVDACDIGTITVWCQPFTAIFTQLAIPRNVFVS